MNPSSGTNSRSWTTTLGGSDLQNYKSYRVYVQARRSSTGAQKLTLYYSTDGSTFTSFSFMSLAVADQFYEGIFDLTNISTIDFQSGIYFRLAASEASSSGTLRIDNLQVQAIKVENGNSGAYNWQIAGNINTTDTSFIGTKDNQDFVVKTNNTERMRFLKTGNIGVGTLTPTEKIHVQNGSIYIDGERGGLIVNEGGQKRVGFMKYSGREAGIWRVANQDFEIGRLNVDTLPGYPTEYNTDIYVSSIGKVGFGTTNPLQQVTIQHNDTTGGILINQYDAGSLIKPSEIKFNHNGVQKWAIGSHISKTSSDPHSFFIWNHISQKVSFFINDSNKVGVGNNTNLQADLDVTGSIRSSNLSGAGTKLLQVNSNGILSTTTVDPSTLSSLNNWHSTDTSHLYTTFANVGIGTNDPQVNLHLKGMTNGGQNPLSTYFRIEDQVYYTPSGGRNVYWDFIVSGVQEKMVFRRTTGGNSKDILTLNEDGKVFIGLDTCASCVSANYDLFVKRGIVTKDVKVTSTMWADHVFAKDYKLMPISELEKYINENNHLPNIPSAKEVISNGFELGNMQQKLLEKVEEQTLYIISLQKQIDELKQLLNQNK